MGRPTRNNAQYFPHFTSVRNHRKIKALRNKFGAVLGYAFFTMMLEWLTEQDGLEWEFSDTECEFFASELGVSAAEIRQLVEYCLTIELLFLTETGFVYSDSLNDNLRPVFDKRQKERVKSKARKRREDGKFVSGKSTAGGVSAAETPQPAAETPQSKVEESKVEESKIKSKSHYTEPAGAGLVSKKDFLNLKSHQRLAMFKFLKKLKPAKKIDYKQQFLEVYIDWYKSRNDGLKPRLRKHDFVHAAQLRKYFRENSKQKTEESAIKSLQWIFSKWDELEPYLKKQLTFAQINNNIVNIIDQLKNGTGTKSNNQNQSGSGSREQNAERLNGEQAVNLAVLLAKK